MSTCNGPDGEVERKGSVIRCVCAADSESLAASAASVSLCIQGSLDFKSCIVARSVFATNHVTIAASKLSPPRFVSPAVERTS